LEKGRKRKERGGELKERLFVKPKPLNAVIKQTGRDKRIRKSVTSTTDIRNIHNLGRKKKKKRGKEGNILPFGNVVSPPSENGHG